MNKIDETIILLRENKSADVREWIYKFKRAASAAEFDYEFEDMDIFDLSELFSFFNDIAEDIPHIYRKALLSYKLRDIGSYDSLSEAEESVSDEISAGDIDAFTYSNMYYPFSYLPVPESIDTSCKVDTVANKLVLSNQSSMVDFSVSAKSFRGVDYVSKGDAVHTFTSFDGEHNLTLSVVGESSFNCLEMDIINSDGCWTEVISAVHEGAELLTKIIQIDHAKRIRLYFDPVESVDITLRTYPARTYKDMYINIVNIKPRLNTYSNGNIKISTKLTGNFFFEIGHTLSKFSSISCSTISDGKYLNKFYPISGERYYFDAVNAEIVINLTTQNNRSTPMLSYVRYGIKSVVADVF